MLKNLFFILIFLCGLTSCREKEGSEPSPQAPAGAGGLSYKVDGVQYQSGFDTVIVFSAVEISIQGAHDLDPTGNRVPPTVLLSLGGTALGPHISSLIWKSPSGVDYWSYSSSVIVTSVSTSISGTFSGDLFGTVGAGYDTVHITDGVFVDVPGL